MTVAPYQVVRLARGRHASPAAGVCAMELASMVAHEPFSDRSPSISPTIGAFLRTYNDGLPDDRRQDLYAVAALVVGSARGRTVERRRVNHCLAFAFAHGTGLPSARASLAMATPEPAGAWAAMAALETEAHADALALVDELVALGHRRRGRLLGERRTAEAEVVPTA
jgi:hypothetical protein